MIEAPDAAALRPQKNRIGRRRTEEQASRRMEWGAAKDPAGRKAETDRMPPRIYEPIPRESRKRNHPAAHDDSG